MKKDSRNMPADMGKRHGRILNCRSTAAIIGGILLALCVFGLLYLNFRASMDLRRNLMHQFHQEAELKEHALMYFFSDANGRIDHLVQSNAVAAYFGSKALGMSMEYGLNLTLPPIRDRSLEVMRSHLVDGNRVFARIVLIGGDGKLLVDAREGRAAEPARSWKSLLSPSLRKATIVTSSDETEVMVSAACYAGKRHEGQIVAWIDPKIVLRLLEEHRFPGRNAFLVTGSREIHPVFRYPSSAYVPALPDPLLSSSDPSEFSLEKPDGTKQAMVGIRLPVVGTPFSFVLMADALQILGRITPQHLLAGMSLGAAFVIALCVYLFFLSIRSSLLKERLEQSILREEARKESEARFRALIENAQDAIVVIDENGAIRYASPSVERVVGYSPEELSGKPVFELLDPAEHGRSLSLLSEAIAHPGAFLPKPREVKLRCKDDTRRTLEFVGRNFLSDSRIGGIVLNVRDITDRRKAEKARALLSRAVEQAAETIVITDTEGKIQYANPAFEKTTGYSRGEALGKNPRILKSGSQTPEFYRSLWETLARGETWTGNFTNRRKDGTTYEEEAVISPVRDGAGKITNFVAVKRDVTSERQMEEQLVQAVKMEAVGKLAGGIAHDFNNLLTAINGYSDLLIQQMAEADPKRQEVAEIRKAAERASALTRQLLSFSRKQIINPKVLDLTAVVADLDNMLRRLIGEDIELLTDPAEGLWKIKVDPGQIEQVIINLAVNARDSMPGGGKLTIETANVHLDDLYASMHQSVRQGPHVMLSVSDTGCGIPREIQARIFDPFFTTKEPGKGTGLGLSTVYGIVKQNMGNIWVYSEPGKGTTFKVYFPRVEASPESASPMEPASEDPETRRGCETLLVAEDDALVRDLLRTILSRTGYTVLEARDGVEAWEIARRHKGPIHMLVTDVVMPRMGGRELANLFANLRKEAKVLFLSGYTDDAIVRHGVLEAGVEFLQKPFRPAELVRKIRTILGGGDLENHEGRQILPAPSAPM
jgi:PAS domain S-box-containing protein